MGIQPDHPCPCDKYENCSTRDRGPYSCCVPEISVNPKLEIEDKSGDKPIDGVIEISSEEERNERNRIKTLFKCLEKTRHNHTIPGIVI